MGLASGLAGGEQLLPFLGTEKPGAPRHCWWFAYLAQGILGQPLIVLHGHRERPAERIQDAVHGGWRILVAELVPPLPQKGWRELSQPHTA
jgi:hypothetical protein